MSRQMQRRLQELVSQFLPVARKRFHHAPICARIADQLLSSKIDIPMQAGRGPVVERVRQWNFRLNPCETESLQRQSFEKRRGYRERMNCRTNVMQKPWQRKFSGTRATAGCGVRFANQNGASRAGQRDRGRKTIRSRANDYSVVFNGHFGNVESVLRSAFDYFVLRDIQA